MIQDLLDDTIHLLQELIQTPSFSGEEHVTADIIAYYLTGHGVQNERLHNNIICRNQSWDEQLPVVILNSHHDTVKVVNGWTHDPHGAVIQDGICYGLGSNDAGASLVCLMAAFLYYHKQKLSFNLMLVASGEEENFGPHGVSSVLASLPHLPTLGIIGEPTNLRMAIAEKGLMVIDATTSGISGHAARDTGLNALYLATQDVEWIRQYKWDHESKTLGPVKTTVTQINAGYQHNVIPDQCTYVIDARINENFTLQEVLDTLAEHCHANLVPRSMRWHPTGIEKEHAIVKRGHDMGMELFGSPTLSDQVHFTCPTVKIGPGQSIRSHTADEHIYLAEIEAGIETYIQLLDPKYLHL